MISPISSPIFVPPRMISPFSSPFFLFSTMRKAMFSVFRNWRRKVDNYI
jgi:hypothetical protein